MYGRRPGGSPGYPVRIAGRSFAVEFVVACIVLLGFSLLALRLRTLRFLATVVRFLPALVLRIPRLDATILDDTRRVRAESLSHRSDRLPMWERGFHYSLDRPVLGYGLDLNRFVEFGRANEETYLRLSRTRGANDHNTHLMLVLDPGLVGVAPLRVFIGIVLRHGFQLYLSPRRGPIETAAT